MKRDFSALQGEFDLLVIGGGIYGAWTAYDATLRGLKVALVEQGDWAGATSSASSKLIHGGLRYLETYDFRLVRKALKERKMLLEAAPHRVWPLRFGVPVYDDSRVGMLKLEAGLTLYDALAGFPGDEMAHRRFRHAEFSGRFPFLDKAHLKGGFTYGDAQTDDARLVLELVSGALEAGAVCVNYCRVERVLGQGRRACGAVVRDVSELACEISPVSSRIVRAEPVEAPVTSSFDKLRTSGNEGDFLEVRARQIVHTGGQWIAAAEPGRGWCRLSKGVHLVMPALSAEEALLLTAQTDGRVFFAIPWYGRTVLGTTDTDYRGGLDHVAVEQDDIDYLLAAANRYFRTAWTAADVIGSYAGLRVMRQSDAAHPSSVSRDWELKTAVDGVLYSVGGKLTSAREDAAAIVNAVCEHLDVATPCATFGRTFPWMPEDYTAWAVAAAAQAERLGIDRESAKWLLRRHGKRADEIFGLVKQHPLLARRIVPDLPFIHADLLLCARDEMVVHLDDLLRRRMPLLILTRLTDDELSRIAGTVAPALGWDEATTAVELAACRQR